MFWFKRISCGIIALVLAVWGAIMVNNSLLLYQFLGFCLFVSGITLLYISIKQKFPQYSFWITLIAIGLAYALLITKTNIETDVVPQEKAVTISQNEPVKVENANDDVKPQEIKKKRKKRPIINLKEYPKISGRATVIQANIFYISGRYVRLYGVDAPDNDQLCSKASGSSYNCGEEATAWMSSWIDDNIIDCYILKVEPKGKDLATCMWGEYDLGAGLVGVGWGIAKTSETNIYKPYEIKARNEFSGLWQGSFYTPEDWRDIKRRQNDFTVKHRSVSKGGFFDFGSWF